jgi:hypothetical protein
MNKKDDFLKEKDIEDDLEEEEEQFEESMQNESDI